MAGGLPGSRAFIPSSPFGTATPSTTTQPGGAIAITASRPASSPEGSGVLPPFSDAAPAGCTETRGAGMLVSIASRAEGDIQQGGSGRR